MPPKEEVAESISIAENDGMLLEAQGLIETDSERGPEAVIIVAGPSANDRIYSEEAIRSGVDVFSGARLFRDHPTPTEQRERPERSIDEVVGVLGTAYVGTDKGGKIALRAPMYISAAETTLATKIKEGLLGGLSIRAWGQAAENDDGQMVVEAFVKHPHTSVDFVTVPAAGGYAEVSESVSEASPQPEPETDEIEESATERRIIALQEANASLQEQVRQLQISEARTVLENALHECNGLPSAAIERIRKMASPLIEAHKSERDDLLRAVKTLVENERAYLARVLPNGVTPPDRADTETHSVEDILSEAFNGLVPDDAIDFAIRGRQD
jgi:hypothetical protein